jgi:hypothetical protein
MKWLLAVALAGCFGKPGFTHRDAPTADGDAADANDAPACTSSKPSATGMVVDTNPANTTVTFLDGSQIGFESVFNRYPMVDRLFVAGQNLVATEETNCSIEDRVGVAVYPVYNVGPESPTGNGIHGLDIDRSGPALTVLRTQWSYPLPAACGANAVGVGNTSWAIYPDGKVVRNDTIVPSDNGPLMAGINNCNCGGANGVTGFIVTSYTTLEVSRLMAVTRAGEPTDATTIPATSMGAEGACARGTTGGAIAMWWDRLDNQDPSPAPTRLRNGMNGATGHQFFALVYDMVAASPETTLIAQDASFGIRTHMLLSAGARACTDLLDDVDSFAALPPITIRQTTGSPMQINASPHSVFEDARAFTGPVEISGTLPPGFALSLRFPGFTAVSTDRAMERVIWQRNSDGSFILFFRDGLSSGTPIRVTPECGS